jgi:hypothetical protein
MRIRGKSINLFLMDGTASGRIKCTLANWTGLAYKIPRTELDKCKERDDLKQSGVYFLFGISDKTGENVVYIGQAGVRKNGEGILFRLQEHKRNPDKDYWTEAVVFTTSNNSFGPTEISYLENRFCNLATESNRYIVKNGNDPTPGNVTEEKESELERINPGDKVHRLETIVKVVSGMDEESLDIIAKVYELVVEAGVHRAESIKVAEAAKVIENSQRDINIAFMNELSIIFNKMGIDTKAVLEAAGTKWNFLNFFPGLVGGHCIGIDPYYLTYKAEQLGYHSQIILSGRRINDDMGKYVAENTVKKMIQANKPIKGANVAILGITFKEDCPDSRNTRVIDIIKELNEYGVNVQVIDPVADAQEVEEEYGIHLNRLDDLRGVDAVIFAVAHEEFVNLSLQEIKDWYRACPNHLFSAINEEVAATIENGCEKNKNVLIDVKGIFDRKEAEELDYLYWRL